MKEALLVAAGSARAALERSPDLDPRLEVIEREAKEAWPALPFDGERYFAQLGRGLANAADPVAALGRVAAADLLLAVACAAGDPRALAIFESQWLPAAERAASRVRGQGTTEDALQDLRAKLLVAEPDRPPRISQYAGQGSLKSWLRISAVRERLMAARSPVPEQGGARAEELLAHAAAKDDVELEHLKSVYRPAFDRAFRRALAALGEKERILLRHVYLDGLTAEDLGRLHRVHRTTMSRRLERIHHQLQEETRNALIDELGLESSGLESIMALIRSEMEISLRGLLR